MAADKQEPAQESWREFASDYERGFIDGMQKQAQSSVDKAVNRMAQPAQDPVAFLVEGLNEGEVIARFMHFKLNEAKKTASVLSHHYPTVNTKPVYTTTPKRPWVGLTDEDRKTALLTAYKEWECEEFLLCAREDYLLIEQALKEKNA
jgi:hypothetical protein